MGEMDLRAEILAYGKEKYHSEAEYLWADTPDAAVLRHNDNRKWYALVMKVERARMGIPGREWWMCSISNVIRIWALCCAGWMGFTRLTI